MSTGASRTYFFIFRFTIHAAQAQQSTLRSMQVHFGIDLLHPEWQRSVACIGTFDGVHLGHQEVIGGAVSRARELELPAILVTFDRHPAAVLAPERCPPAIAPLQSNLGQFGRCGVDVAVILEFTRELSQTSAESFYHEILGERLHTEELVVGHDFAFGRDRQGTPEWLQQRIPTRVIPPFGPEGHRISSSEIRQAIGEGRVEDAGRWLGRPFEVSGVVVHGQKLGRTLGFPTINLARSFQQVMPGFGVYAGTCDTPFGTFRAGISVGVRPTVSGEYPTIEAYLLDYPGDSLYGYSVVLRLVKRLRDEEKFAGLEELKNQMNRDIAEVRRVL